MSVEFVTGPYVTSGNLSKTKTAINNNRDSEGKEWWAFEWPSSANLEQIDNAAAVVFIRCSVSGSPTLIDRNEMALRMEKCVVPA